jgi:LmbE family N-acetylglucosaminyl deacetylase
VLFVLAHQDDECAVSTRIVDELRRGRRVWCIFLTDGAGSDERSRIRDAESRRVLSALGVREDQMLFLGSTHGLHDTTLVEHLEEAYEIVESAVGHHRFVRIYCLAYEGGHQDHDASHALALAFAQRRGLLGRTWQAPFYQGCDLPWKLFRVLAPLPGSARPRGRRLPARTALGHALLGLRYPSQWRTWVGLFPPWFARRALQRRDLLQPVDPHALRDRPHPGPLLYERLQNYPYAQFRRALDPFLEAHGL